MKRRFLFGRDRVGEKCTRLMRVRANSCPVLFLCMALCAVTISGCSPAGGKDPETEPCSKETRAPQGQEETGETETDPEEKEPRFGTGEMWTREYDLAAFLEMYSAEIPEELIPEKTVTLKIAGADHMDLKKDDSSDSKKDSSSDSKKENASDSKKENASDSKKENASDAKNDSTSASKKTEGTVLTGPFADVLKEKFHIEIKLVDAKDPSADLILFDPSAPEFAEAVKEGKVVDLEGSGLLEKYGAYLTFADAASLDHVRMMTEAYTSSVGKSKDKTEKEENKDIAENKDNAESKEKEKNKDKEENKDKSENKNKEENEKDDDAASEDVPLYGVGTMTGYRNESFVCGRNLPSIRFDVYQEAGEPNIATLEDLPDILALMVMTCPRDDEGGKTYGVTYSREWDGDLPYLLRTTANLYGYEDWGLGFYNVETRTFEPLLKENGIGIRMLRYYNELYRRGLIDPDSETQSMDEAREKIARGTAMWDPDPTEYNTKKHLSEGKAMLFLPADDFVICDQSIAPWKPERILSIGAKSEHQELCMALINWLATPEGCMSGYYGRQGENWDYDETGVPYLTEKGRKLFENEAGAQALKYLHIWAPDAVNPVTSGFTYRAEDWPSAVLGSRTKIEEEWSKYTGYASAGDLLVQEEMVALTATTGMTAFPAVPGPLNPSWRGCVDQILKDCHAAIGSKTEKEFNAKLEELKKHLQENGYAECEQYCYDAAALRRSSENALDRMLVWEEETEIP